MCVQTPTPRTKVRASMLVCTEPGRYLVLHAITVNYTCMYVYAEEKLLTWYSLVVLGHTRFGYRGKGYLVLPEAELKLIMPNLCKQSLHSFLLSLPHTDQPSCNK